MRKFSRRRIFLPLFFVNRIIQQDIMKVSCLTALAATISSVVAVGDLAFNLGVQDNAGSCKTASEYQSDFKRLSPYSKIIKTYAVSDCNTLQILGPAAESAGFQIILGVWPTDDAHFQAEQDALTTYLPSISISTIKAISVGSEALYRGDLTASQLADDISTVKKLLSGIKDKNGQSYGGMPVGFVDSWNVIVDGTANDALSEADFIYANAFSYWQGQTLANSSYSFFDDIMQALQKVQSAKGSTDINFYVGETGWPSEGTAYESAQPGVDEATTYWQQAVCAMRGWGVNVAVFEAFDEAWKPDTSGTSDVEKHWGVYDENNNLKYSLDCLF